MSADPTQRYDSGTPWEAIIGYSRAIRRGPFVCVSGTTAMDGDRLVGPGDAGAQARFVFAKVIRSLAAVGAQPTDVVRTRMYITDPRHADAVTAAHAAALGAVRPATTLLIVRGFIDPALLVEVEADAVVLPPTPTLGAGTAD